QPYLADRALESSETTLQLVRKGSYADFLPVVPEAFPLEVEPFAFKLYDVQPLGEGVSIFGTAFFDKEELKAWVKGVGKRLKAPESDWLVKLQWTNKEGCLLPQGVEEVERWRQEWRRWTKAHGLLEISTFGDEKAHLTLAKQFKSGVAEWNFSVSREDSCTLAVSRQEALAFLISSLQFIQETVKLLEVSVEWIAEFYPSSNARQKEWKQGVACLEQAMNALAIGYEESLLPPSASKPTLSGFATDGRGGKVKLPSLSVDFSRENEVLIRFSLLGPLMRFLAMQAEKRAVT
ncbi:MAG: hypothetical protein ACK5MA_00920, partial [Parachlamydiaceae bacterium]